MKERDCMGWTVDEDYLIREETGQAFGILTAGNIGEAALAVQARNRWLPRRSCWQACELMLETCPSNPALLTHYVFVAAVIAKAKGEAPDDSLSDSTRSAATTGRRPATRSRMLRSRSATPSRTPPRTRARNWSPWQSKPLTPLRRPLRRPCNIWWQWRPRGR